MSQQEENSDARFSYESECKVAEFAVATVAETAAVTPAAGPAMPVALLSSRSRRTSLANRFLLCKWDAKKQN